MKPLGNDENFKNLVVSKILYHNKHRTLFYITDFESRK